MMKRRLTERDVTRIVSRVLNEQVQPDISECLKGISSLPNACKSVVADKPIDAKACLKELTIKVLSGDPAIGKAIACITEKMSSGVQY